MANFHGSFSLRFNYPVKPWYLDCFLFFSQDNPNSHSAVQTHSTNDKRLVLNEVKNKNVSKANYNFQNMQHKINVLLYWVGVYLYTKQVYNTVSNI